MRFLIWGFIIVVGTWVLLFTTRDYWQESAQDLLAEKIHEGIHDPTPSGQFAGMVKELLKGAGKKLVKLELGTF